MLNSLQLLRNLSSYCNSFHLCNSIFNYIGKSTIIFSKSALKQQKLSLGVLLESDLLPDIQTAKSGVCDVFTCKLTNSLGVRSSRLLCGL